MDDPVGTLEKFQQLAEIEAREIGAQIHFEDQYCLDVGAYLLLAEVWPNLAPIFQGGKMTRSVAKVLRRVNLENAFRGASFPRDDNARDVWAIQVQRRQISGPGDSATPQLDPQRKEKVADWFCDRIDEWLGVPEIKQMLSALGRANFQQIIGEILDNAERHSAPETGGGQWSIVGFMARRAIPGNGGYEYHAYLGFLSVGASIAESIMTAPEKVRKKIDWYANTHRRQGVQSIETLRTLMAIQDGITRDAAAVQANRGGVGMLSIVEIANEIGGSYDPRRRPRITFTSGSTCISLRDPYITLKTSNGEPNEPRRLFCNLTNSPNDPPDSTFVRDLDYHFPGTLISMDFVLDPHFLTSTISEDEHHGPDN
ncbi:hypothetical protein GTQ45_14850 [Pyruvatibacter mobilis]|uniref:Uncharacterized protein n=1 Tax=Pyruvatibacter mobilis TaxID=1712261 RepID=A0A845QFG4_9HYPH|nr:hypothetical protein [Pyruvatibacter mobilis]GGD06924.1 hypothetical protein GCM10011587_08580 [Pyruvatibacter mobilis]